MGMSPISADEARRLREEVERGPLFSKYPPVVDIGFAFTVALEHIEEWSHADDPDGWCHQRPILLTLAAEVERLSADNEKLREAASLAVTSLQAEHEPQWASDEMKARGKDPLGCVMCWPKDGGWPCNSRTEADDLAAALVDEGDR